MNYEIEFEVVDLILNSDFETRGVDAFSLSLLKMERQMRRIFTHLVFQAPEMNEENISVLISTLADKRNIYFKHFILGINEIYFKEVRDICGEKFQEKWQKIDSALEIRNKIFHGQLTGNNLSRDDYTI